MSWRDLPSLPALRAFEAAARHGSFSAAARELNVTHAAVAQHVRGLEDVFGRALMRREGNSMAVTREAQPLADALAEARGLIAAAVRDLRDRDAARPLRLTTTPSFAANWLMPRIGRFWAQHPDIALELIPALALSDLRAEGIDAAIRYGRGPWPGLENTPLMPAGHVAVGAPARYAGHPGTRLTDFRGETWLLDHQQTEEKLWATSQGLDLDAERTRVFDTAELEREAAKAGLGIAILPAPLADPDIAAGTLRALCRETDSALAYHLVTRPGPRSEALKALIRWLKSAAAG